MTARLPMFFDPADLLHFDVPLGWGYDPFSSTFSSVSHRRWSDAAESLTVLLRPRACSPLADDATWLENSLTLGPTIEGARLLRPRRSTIGGGYVAGTDRRERIVLVRGARLDAAVVHAGGSRQDEILSAPVSLVLDTIGVPANLRAPPPLGEEVRTRLAELADPFEDRRLDAAELVSDGRLALLHGWASGDRSLDFMAAWSIVLGLLAHGAAESDAGALYLAEQTMSRLVPGLDGEPDEVARTIDQARLSIHRAVLSLPASAAYWDRLRQTLRKAAPEWVGVDGELLRPLPDLTGHLLHCNALLETGRTEGEPLGSLTLRLAVYAGFSALVLSRLPSDPPSMARYVESGGLVAVLEGLDQLGARGPLREEDLELRVTLRRRWIDLSPDPSDSVRLAHEIAQLVVGRERRVSAEDVARSRALVEEARALIAGASSLSRVAARQVAIADALVCMAEESSERAIDIIRDLLVPQDGDEPIDLDEARGQLAVAVLTFHGDVDEAARILEAVGASDSSPVLLQAKALLSFRRGDINAAIRLIVPPLMAAAAAAAAEELEPGTRGILFLLADGLRGSPSAAADYVDAAIVEVDRLYLIGGFTDDEQRVAFGQTGEHRMIAEALVGGLLNRGLAAAALSVADDIRGFVLGRSLRQPSSTSPPPVPAQPATDTLQREALDAVRLLRTSVRRTLHAAGYPVASPPEVLVATATEGGRQALILQPVDDVVHLLLIDPDGKVHATISPLSRTEIEQHLHRVRRALGIVEVGRRGQNPFLARLGAAQASGEAALVGLRTALLDPVVEKLAAAPLAIVPYGSYALVPWGVLGASHALDDELAISTVPSLTVLSALRAGRQPRSRPGRVLVVAEPAVDPSLDLSALPGAVAEADGLLGALYLAGVRDEDVRSLRGPQATDAAVRDGATPDLVHFACHAAADAGESMPALYLAPGAGDGLLTPAEIAEVPVNDGLVVLSACETGAGAPTVDGIVGLARSFLQAGARTVVMSLWEVDDHVTEPLIAHFYRSLLGHGGSAPVPVDVALALAARDVRRQLAEGHITDQSGVRLRDDPRLWAPFVVLGDGAFSYGA